MEILISSYAFRPSIGGLETVSEILAEQFVAAGHKVMVVTETNGADDGTSYEIVRRPSLPTLVDLLRRSDVVLQNNISLRSLLPALLLRKRTIVTHQTWIRDTHGRIRWNGFVKRRLLSQVKNVAISRAIADDLRAPSTVIFNPYRDNVFKRYPELKRDRSLVFVGRLVSDKGVDLLLRALAEVRADGLVINLTIIGEGPEANDLATLSHDLRLDNQVTFAGKKSGAELARLLNRHRIMVVPSRWAEPFGVVALEGIACGCAIVGSEAGGLKEATGACGVTFENNSIESLKHALRRVLCDPALEQSLRAAAPSHLQHFKAHTIARAYLDLIDRTTT